jgi:hypothetical protein
MKDKKTIGKNRFVSSGKVICINDDFSNIPALFKVIFSLPVAGRIYTVRRRKNSDSILLKEITNEVMKFRCGTVTEPGFFIWRFQPLTNIDEEVHEKQRNAKPEKVRITQRTYDTNLETSFNNLTDNQKLSMFMKRINQNQSTLYDDLLKSWWESRY